MCGDTLTSNIIPGPWHVTFYSSLTVPYIYKGNKYLDQFDWTTAVTVFPPFKTSIFGSLVVDWKYDIIKWHYTMSYFQSTTRLPNIEVFKGEKTVTAVVQSNWSRYLFPLVFCAVVCRSFVCLFVLFLSAIVVSVLILFMASSGYLFSILKLVWHFHLFSTHLQLWNWSMYVPI